MHKQYGPIVRITPNEVHFADPEFLDELYPTGGRKIEKPSWFALLTGSGCFFTISPSVLAIQQSEYTDA